MKIALAQLSPFIGDVNRNLSQVEKAVVFAHNSGASILVFPELFLLGYPVMDTLEWRHVMDDVDGALERVRLLSAQYPGMAVILGSAVRNEGLIGKPVRNSAVVFCNGERVFTQHKTLLPQYDVFNDARYFEPSLSVDVVELFGQRFGITICEDMWNKQELGRERYAIDPVKTLGDRGVDCFINLSASPFEHDKLTRRIDRMFHYVTHYKVPFIYVNQVGAYDELVFDGRSLVMNSLGQVCHVGGHCKTSVDVIDLDALSPVIEKAKELDDDLGYLRDVLVFGIREYVMRSGFKQIVIGLSGGIDSAIVASLAVEALGSENVIGIMMPSIYSSKGSILDSEDLAQRLGIQTHIIPIGPMYDAFERSLESVLDGTRGVAFENVQARIRGTLLMTYANHNGCLVLPTGNKSELAVGYSTLYGDMNGALLPIGDLYKTQVFALAKYMNKSGVVIPQSIIDKPPSAELRPDQRDDDTLPPYDVLDLILYKLLEGQESIQSIVEAGSNNETVEWVSNAIAQNEYKRRQAPPVIKVSSKAFGLGRQYLSTQKQH
ncbi:MAG: NAD+ synthase [bacterium]|nr:NAD+ synthase [bacterium]